MNMSVQNNDISQIERPIERQMPAKPRTGLWLWAAGLFCTVAIIGGMVWSAWQAGEATRRDADNIITAPGPAPVGILVPLSGSRKRIGEEMQRAAQIAVEEINAGGGIHGFSLDAVFGDSACDAEQASKAFDRMIDQSIKIFIGGVCPGEAAALARGAKERGVMFISLVAQVSPGEDAGGSVFQLAMTRDARLQGLASYLRNEIAAKQVLFFIPPREESRALAASYGDAFGPSVMTRSLELPTIPESYDALLTVLADESIDTAVLLMEDKDFIAGLAEALHARDPKVRVFVEPDLFDSLILSDRLDALEGVLTVGASFSVSDEPTKLLFDRYRDRFGIPWYPHEIVDIYSGLFLVRDMYTAMGLRVEQMPQYLAGLSAWSGGVFRNLAFDEDRQALRDVVVRRVQEGAVIRVKVY